MSTSQIQLAQALQQQGRLPEAVAAYRKLLASEPRNAQALHLFFQAIQTAILPGNLGYDTARNWGPVPLECWVLSGALYMALVAAVQESPNVKRILAFSRPALETSVPPGAIVDVASEAGEAPSGEVRPVPAI